MDSERPPAGGLNSSINETARADSPNAGPAQVVAAAVLPHLDAAFNLARWLTRDDHDAADVVQDAYVRAMRSAATYRGSGAKAWLLTIVRNAAFDRMRSYKSRKQEELSDEASIAADAEQYDPQEILLRAANAERVRRAIEDLPSGIREVIVLREMEGMSYKEIAGVIAAPIGTVMSRLARGRQRLQELLSESGEAKEAGRF